MNEVVIIVTYWILLLKIKVNIEKLIELTINIPIKKNAQSYKRFGTNVLVLIKAAITHNKRKFIDEIPIGKFCTTSLIIPAKKINPKPIASGFFKAQ